MHQYIICEVTTITLTRNKGTYPQFVARNQLIWLRPLVRLYPMASIPKLAKLIQDVIVRREASDLQNSLQLLHNSPKIPNYTFWPFNLLQPLQESTVEHNHAYPLLSLIFHSSAFSDHSLLS